MSTQPTQAAFGVADRAADRAAASGPDARPRRGDDRRLPRGPRPDRGRDRPAADHHRPRRQRPLHLGVHRLSADLDDQRPALRQAVRPVRPAADLPVRHRHLHGRLAAGRACRRRCGSSSLARGVQGLGAGALFPIALAVIARPVRAVGARPLPGPVRRRVRPVRAHRSGDRRAHHRHDRLAVRVLLQPAHRRGRVRHGLALPAALPPRRRTAADRLSRRGPVHGARSCRSSSG